MTGIIDVGGGIRGAYGAGVFDRCLEENIEFDQCIGVSAGAANAVTYLANQKGRLYRFYGVYPFRKEYMSLSSLLKTGEYLSLGYIYDVLSVPGGEDPYGYEEGVKHSEKSHLAVTNAETGKSEFYGIKDMQADNLWVLKASCCIPFVCKPVRQNGKTFYDGGIADPVPIDYALSLGCDKLVIILTRPVDYKKESGKDINAARLIKHKYPEISKLLLKRAENYNAGVEKALRLEKEGRALIIAPDDTCGVDTLAKSPESVKALYDKGYKDAEKIKNFI